MFKEKIKSLVVTKKDKGNNKKTVENLVVLLILLVVTIVAINTIWGDKQAKVKQENDRQKTKFDSYRNSINTDRVYTRVFFSFTAKGVC